MKRGLLLALGFIVVLGIILGLNFQNEPDFSNTEVPGSMQELVILELFTSQGCSSCPPAESVLSKIAKDKRYIDSVIPLAYHVDYWDYLGWKDPFASSEWTARQADYRQAHGGATLYTPQIVIQGEYEMVGSDENRIKRQINSLFTDQAPSLFDIAIHHSTLQDKTLLLDVNTNRLGPSFGDVLMLVSAVYENIAATEVGAGENRGRTLRNNYVVRSVEMKPLMFEDVEQEKQIQVSLLLDDNWQIDNMGIATWIQDPKTMKIYAADRVKKLVKESNK